MVDGRQPTPLERLVAFLEVLLCSGFPTQLAIGGTLGALGYGAFDQSGALSLRYVVGLSLVDTVAVVALVFFFLLARGERPKDVIIGRGPVSRELAAGVPMTFVALAIAVAVVLLTRVAAPWLHTVETNPMQGLLTTRRSAVVFGFVVVVAGGIREEIQRAFILHRFEVWLGGATTGLVVTSVAFGAGHFIQGADAALATGILGAYWAAVYYRRRSALAPMISHAGFDLLQVLGFVAARSSQF